MRAARLHAYGAQLVLGDLPEPTPGPRDLLVQIHASSIKPIDFKIHAGGQRAFVRLALPWITGLDLSCTVLAAGSQVQGFQVGDAVYISPTHKRPGTFAERVAVDQDQVALKPPSLSHTESASLPLVFQTAWASLMPALTRPPGQRVFIQAGSGGVGTVAIQLAKHRRVARWSSRCRQPLRRPAAG
ncbi:MAG: NADPH:quinone reductase-like Zn-dependent oxidoreductase [Cognaticolwellia sp.]|jgi:NADPH:quinone reductase-like Zn-dependent oxidoreductase